MIGPIIADIQGTELTPEDYELLQHPLIGGVILFTRNYTDGVQLMRLVQTLKAIKRDHPLLVSVDHEGGRVQRFHSGFTTLPSMSTLGKLYDQSAAAALKAAFLIGWLLAAELKHYGIDYSYTPVLDLDYQVSAVIGDRAFHRHPLVVVALAQALIAGLQEAGMAAVGKHFPGHGAVAADSHIAIPIDEREMEQIEEDMQPYRVLLQQNQLTAIMTAHVIYEKIDAQPPCFSEFWLQRILRDELNFQGAIISDDLCMKGAEVAGNYATRAELALQAGCDLLLICNNRAAVQEALTHISQFYMPNQQTQTRCLGLYGYHDPIENLTQHPNWSAAMTVITELNTIK